MRLTQSANLAAMNAVLHLLDGGTLELLNPDALTVATLGFGTPAFTVKGSGGVATPITPDRSAAAPGPVDGFRCRAKDGAVILDEGTVGLVGSEADLELKRLDVQPGSYVEVTSFLVGMTDEGEAAEQEPPSMDNAGEEEAERG